MPSTVTLHCGLHKTGTSAIQQACAEHRDRLRAHGLLYPTTGHDEVGHHNLAWQLAADRRFDAGAITVDRAIEQIAAFDGDALLSSEDFETLLDRPAALAPLTERLHGTGREVRLVIYLREPRTYADSLYVELLAHGYAEPYDDAMRQIRATGRLRWREWGFQFDYRALRSALAGSAGIRPVFRDYDAVARRGSVVRDLLAVIGRPADLLAEAGERRVNARITDAQTLSLFYANNLAQPPDTRTAALIERLCGAASVRLGRLCSHRSVQALAALAAMPPDAPQTAAAERALVRWWSGRLPFGSGFAAFARWGRAG